jgi:hypothetical protein
MQFLSLIKRKLKSGLIRLNGHRTTEVYFISYPKTGTTWSQFLLGKYLQLKWNLPEAQLSGAYDKWGRCAKPCTGPKISFTHLPLVWTNQSAADLGFHNVIKPFLSKKVVLIIRNTLDTLVSHWFDEKYRQKDRYHVGNLTDFINNPNFSLEKLIRFYKLWHESFHTIKGFHLLRYEAMKMDAIGEFRDLLSFLNIEEDEAVLKAAIRESSFEKMQNMEKSGEELRNPLGYDLLSSGDRNNVDSYKVRRGKVGGYVDYFNPEEISQLFSIIAQAEVAWFSEYLEPPTPKISVK